jgi:23S rRNA (guanosine2251-2'-O)-methyltransferase
VKDSIHVTGCNAVSAILEERPERVIEFVVLADARPHPGRDALRLKAESLGIPLSEEDSDFFRRVAGGRNAQGVAALLKPFPYTDLHAIADSAGEQSVLVVLDGVTDPHNLGAIVRSAAFFGADGVVIPKDRSVAMTPVAERISSGGAQIVPIARVANLSRALQDLQDAGYWVVGTVAEDGEALEDVDLSGRTVVVLGAEGSGMRRLTRKRCDRLVCLPGGHGGLESLNVSVFGGVMLYEVHRQREARKKQGGKG